MKHKFTKEDYEQAVKVSLSYAGVCRYLGISPRGGNYATIKNKLKEYNIDISHFTGKGWNVGMVFKPMKQFKLEDVLQKDFPYNTQRLKNRLIESGIKEHKCEKCQRTEWNGDPIPLELHHINGDRTDNRLENLQILCPNCHAQTDHYRGKNMARIKKITPEFKSDVELEEDYEKRKSEITKEKEEKIKQIKEKYVISKPKRYCKKCGVELGRKQGKYCSQECAHNDISKRPSVVELMEVIKEHNNNMSAVGRHYGVSDNAVRKWIKLYKI